jgi:hypothetical protein
MARQKEHCTRLEISSPLPNGGDEMHMSFLEPNPLSPPFGGTTSSIGVSMNNKISTIGTRIKYNYSHKFVP